MLCNNYYFCTDKNIIPKVNVRSLDHENNEYHDDTVSLNDDMTNIKSMREFKKTTELENKSSQSSKLRKNVKIKTRPATANRTTQNRLYDNWTISHNRQ